MSDVDSIKGKLLVVDDNEMNRDMLSRRLLRRGHEVATANDGREALAAIAEDHFDVVLLDVTMPVMDGFECLVELRKTFSPTQLPVIMVTARDESDDVISALKAGANDYVTKPLDFPVVAARLQTQLSLKNAVDRILQLESDLTLQNEQLLKVNARMKRDLDAAARIQQAGLPRSVPHTDAAVFAWAYQPCDELGGDSLNIIQLDDRYIALYVLDVSGHGVQAALLSVTLNRELTPRGGAASMITDTKVESPGVEASPPASVAERLNRVYPMDMETQQYFTVIYGLFDTQTNNFRFVGAGHPGPVLANGGDKAEVQQCPGFPIGIVDDADYDEHVIQLQPGDRVFMYSDGIIEEADQDDEQFGHPRLIDSIQQTSELPLQATVDRILENVKEWTGGADVRDDLTVLAMEVLGKDTQESTSTRA